MITTQEEKKTMFSTIELGLKDIQKIIDKRQIERDDLQRTAKRLNTEIINLEIENYEKAAVYMKELAQNQKIAASAELSKLGTMALRYAFGKNYEMEIEMSGSDKNSKAYVWFIKDGKKDDKEDPMEDNGGGVVDIISNAIRIEIMDAYDDPVIDGPIIFDEPYKMVSDEYIPQTSQFIANVSKDFGRQVIVVTHEDYISSLTDLNIYVSLDENERSVITVIRNRKEE
jgi:hypothetical protein